jgi:hypothetical protein
MSANNQNLPGGLSKRDSTLNGDGKSINTDSYDNERGSLDDASDDDRSGDRSEDEEEHHHHHHQYHTQKRIKYEDEK